MGAVVRADHRAGTPRNSTGALLGSDDVDDDDESMTVDATPPRRRGQDNFNVAVAERVDAGAPHGRKRSMETTREGRPPTSDVEVCEVGGVEVECGDDIPLSFLISVRE